MSPDSLLMQLYGYSFDMIARTSKGQPQFPISIEICDYKLTARPKQDRSGEFEVTRPLKSP
ncbi:MAG: hypothetical protein DRN99_06435 [Thermoproteota archaeon]|nr:MAG: hypothetical protein DRN99_06435 [Candidatus Korarchaeota archaeon]